MKKINKKWLLPIPHVLLILAGICLFQFRNMKYIVYSGQWTYTMSDDREKYLIRFPGLYVVPFTSSYKINVLRIPLIPETVNSFSTDGLELVSSCMKRYHGHFNLDYSLKTADGQITVTYMGSGKLDDGSLETIDEVKTYPLFSFEDRSDGQWIPSEYPWAEGIDPIFQDPDQVVDPFYSGT